jgi:hypothetical protein
MFLGLIALSSAFAQISFEACPGAAFKAEKPRHAPLMTISLCVARAAKGSETGRANF